MKKFLVLVVCCLCLVGCDSEKDNQSVSESNNSSQNQSSQSNQNNGSKKEYKLNEPFKFDDLEITISSNYEFSSIDNEYSEHNNNPVVKIPVTVKNLKNETHSLNMFYYTFLGSKGTELDNVSSYFDDCIDHAGDLRQDASYTKYFYLLYDGDGTYTIEFDNFHNKINFDISITK